MSALPLFGPEPEVPLCQHPGGGCAACCGTYNFVDRSPAAEQDRLRRRSQRIEACRGPEGALDEDLLREARDGLLALEAPDVLSAAIKVCPFAGFLDDEDHVGCLIHPARHAGRDLRHLAVHPIEVCQRHFCAPHDWLDPVEQALAQTARGPLYGRVVTDAGLVKAVARLIADEVGGRLVNADIDAASTGLQALWQLLLLRWPFADPDPRRFGGFWLEPGDDGVERTLPRCVAGFDVTVDRALVTVFDAAGSRFDSPDDVDEAISTWNAALAGIVAAIAERRET